jgi:hypothetical protein
MTKTIFPWTSLPSGSDGAFTRVGPKCIVACMKVGGCYHVGVEGMVEAIDTEGTVLTSLLAARLWVEAFLLLPAIPVHA